MADRAFQMTSELAKGTMVLTNFEQGIVPESVVANFRPTDPSLASTGARSVDDTLWIGNNDVANVVCLPFAVLDRLHFFEQQCVIFFVRCLATRKPCGINPRLSLECINAQPAILTEDPTAEVACLLTRFFFRIFRKRRSIFDHIDRLWIISERADLDR